MREKPNAILCALDQDPDMPEPGKWEKSAAGGARAERD